MTAQEFMKRYIEIATADLMTPEEAMQERFKRFKDSLSPMGVAKHLSNIANSQPYISYIKYAEYEFNLAKFTAIKYKQVGDKFMADFDHSVFYAGGKDFSLTALIQLLKFSVEEIDGFIRKGLLKVGETGKSIKEKIQSGVLSNG